MIGCSLKRVSGDHFIYSRSDLKRPVVLTNDREVPIFIIRNNLRTLNISVDEYLEALRQL